MKNVLYDIHIYILITAGHYLYMRLSIGDYGQFVLVFANVREENVQKKIHNV